MEDKFYNLALHYLSYRTRSEKEVCDKLKTKKVEPQIIEKIISKLKEKRFINDEDFARQWIENRSRFRPRSMRLVKLELRQKGIANEIIEKIFQNSEVSITSDLDQAKKLVEKRIERLKNLPKQEMYQKLGRYLASKGFDWDTIKKVIDEMLAKGV